MPQRTAWSLRRRMQRVRARDKLEFQKCSPRFAGPRKNTPSVPSFYRSSCIELRLFSRRTRGLAYREEEKIWSKDLEPRVLNGLGVLFCVINGFKWDTMQKHSGVFDDASYCPGNCFRKHILNLKYMAGCTIQITLFYFFESAYHTIFWFWSIRNNNLNRSKLKSADSIM